MATLIDVNEYFKGEGLPHGNPWQKTGEQGLVNEKNEALKKKDSLEPNGYNKQKLNNNSKNNTVKDTDYRK
jgi:hypothetical protein